MEVRDVWSRGGWIALAVVAVLIAAPLPARAQESITVAGTNFGLQTAVETDWGIATAGKNNAFNDNFHRCASHSQPGCGLATDGNSWNMMAYRADSLLNMKLSSQQAAVLGFDDIEGFLHGRLWSDLSQFVDGDLPGVNAQGFRQRYPGNGWAASISEHEYEIDAAEAYLDLRKGPLWLRIGKQQIVYGEELGVQTLDQVDSLDLRRHSLMNYSGLEFSDARIAEWTLRASYDLGGELAPLYMNSTRITGWISPDFEPDIFLPAGSPYNLAVTSPAYVVLENLHGISRARHKLVYGAVLESNSFGVDWSLNFYSTPEHVGWFRFTGPPIVGGLPNPQVFPVDNFRGTQLFGPAGGFHDLMLTREMPRIFMYGGMVSYTIQPVYQFPGADLFNGDMVRLSGIYTPNKAFTGPDTLNPASPRVNRPLSQGEINIALDIERDWRWTERLESAYVVVEYNFRSRSDLFDDYLAQSLFGNHHNFNLVVTSVTQPLALSRWNLVWAQLIEGNGGGSILEQPAVVYKPTSSQEYRVFWNFATGTNSSYLGPLRYADEIVLAAIYKF